MNVFPAGITKFLRDTFRMSTTAFCGRYGIMPYRAPLVMCFGQPIEVNQITPPANNRTSKAFDTEVERCFELYKAGLREVYEFYQEDIVGYSGRGMEIS